MKKKFVQLTDVIEGVLASRGGAKELLLSRMLRDWEKIAGRNIWQHSRPHSIRNKKLSIIVDSPAWVHHLSFMQIELMEKINAFFDNQEIEKVVFKTGHIESRLQKKAAKRPGLSAKVSSEDKKLILKITKNIDDEELKIRLERVLSKQSRLKQEH